jgi:hypothetical protein
VSIVLSEKVTVSMDSADDDSSAPSFTAGIHGSAGVDESLETTSSPSKRAQNKATDNASENTIHYPNTEDEDQPNVAILERPQSRKLYLGE